MTKEYNLVCDKNTKDCQKLSQIVQMVKKIVQMKDNNNQLVNAAAGAKFDNIKWYPSINGSYTINKSSVYLCLRNKTDINEKTGEHNFYPDYMLLHVALHEFAHVICDENGHTLNFGLFLIL